MNEGTSPYSAHELARARAVLSSEVSSYNFRFLQRRLAQFSQGCDENLWEGPNGMMEHISMAFPMPPRRNPEPCSSNSNDPSKNAKRNIKDTSNSCKEENDLISALTGQSYGEIINVESSDVKVVNGTTSNEEIIPVESSDGEIVSDGLSEGEIVSEGASPSNDEQVEHKSSQPNSKSKRTEKQKKQDRKNLLKHYKNIYESQNGVPKLDDVICHSSDDISKVSNAEKRHWKELAKLQNRIKEAHAHLLKIKRFFKLKENEKGCQGIQQLHSNVHNIITTLTNEKKLKDTYKFLNQKFTDSTPSLKTTIPMSYCQTWILLRRLCVKFKTLWRRNDEILSEFNTLQDVTRSTVDDRIKNIVSKS